MLIQLSEMKLIQLVAVNQGTTWYGHTFHITGHLWGESTVQSAVVSLTGTVMLTFRVSFAVSLNKQLNKQMSCCWFDKPWHSCGISLMIWYYEVCWDVYGCTFEQNVDISQSLFPWYSQLTHRHSPIRARLKIAYSCPKIFQIPVMVSNKIIKALHYWPFVTGIHWWPMDPSCKRPVMWKVFISISLYDHVMVIFLSLPDFCGDCVS